MQSDTRTRSSGRAGSIQVDGERCRRTNPRDSGRTQQARADQSPRQGQRHLPRCAGLRPGSSRHPMSRPGTDLSYALAGGPEGSGPAPGGRRPSAAPSTSRESWGHSAAPRDGAFDHPPPANGKRAEPCEAAAGRALWVLLQTEGRAGRSDRTETCFFPKAIFKTQILGTPHRSGQARQAHSSQCHPNLPSPARAFAELLSTLRTRRKRRDFNQFGGHLPRTAFFSPPAPLPVRCSPGSSALQADAARGKRQISVLQ